MTQDTLISLRGKVAAQGYAMLAAHGVKSTLSEAALEDTGNVSASFGRLPQDHFMGDSGCYRFRRFSRFVTSIDHSSGHRSLLEEEGNSICQSLEDNQLNGGVERTFAPLESDTVASPLLRELIRHDTNIVLCLDPELFQKPVLIGVHQVRIVATPDFCGKPTPEGIHRDAERFTFQHFWSRVGVQGGDFRVYDQQKQPVDSWLQTERFDSVVFRGTTWHSAAPISWSGTAEQAYRDIFLIDFDPL